MNKKRIAQYCCAALVAAGVGLNIQNAIADYGIAENSLSLVAVGGSNSGSNSNSNSNSNTTPDGPRKSMKAIDITRRSCKKPIGFKMGISIDIRLKAALTKLLGKEVTADDVMYTEVTKYMETEKVQQFKKDCVPDPEGNCICALGSSGWQDIPDDFREKPTRCN